MQKVSAALIACSPQGYATALQLAQSEAWRNDFASVLYLPRRYRTECVEAQGYDKLSSLVAKLFTTCDCLVFFCACGIAVRTIAPLLQDKYCDPAVVVCDEAGRFAISLLSGHVGGANLYAQRIAAALDAQPVITTATDVHHVFAVDAWAMQQKLHIVERPMVKEIAARLLQGQSVGFASDYPWHGETPTGLTQDKACPWGVCVSSQLRQPFAHTLHLQPRNIVLGIGCRKGVTVEQLDCAWQQFLQQTGLTVARIAQAATIDLKRQETGLLAWTAQKKLSLTFYSSQQLQQATGQFTPSAFVQHITGVDNVCERSAALASNQGRQLACKCRLDGVTMAAYERAVELYF